MRFDNPRWRRASRLAASACVVVAATLGACAEGLGPLTSTATPDSLVVTAVRPGAIRVSWAPLQGASGAQLQYIVERRTNLTGAFVEVVRLPDPNLSSISWIDTDVQPETLYGYRVFALSALGDRSPPSVIGGALTPPRPGIEVATSSSATVAEALDPNGYTLTIVGPDTVRATIGVDATRRFSPLKTGRYMVSLSDVTDRCAVAGQAAREVIVTDTSATTIAPIGFNVVCRDPNRGDLAVVLAVTGADRDNAFTLDVLGEASDNTLPPAERVFAAQRNVNGGPDANAFQNLRPGGYTVTLRDIAANCLLTGAAQRTATVTKLGIATVTYAIACTGTSTPAPPANPTAPFIWRNRWVPKSGATNSTAVLESTLDLTARTGQNVKGVQASISYNPAALRFEGEDVGQLNQLVLNATTPGQINIIAQTTSAARTGTVSLFKLNFTVIGASGLTSPTVSTDVKASSQVGTAPAVAFGDSVRIVEDTFTVGSGTGTATGVNQAPVARAGGPYTGTAGTAITLSGAGSSDPDGTIASYAWTFGDNTTGTGVTPSKTYATAGTYTATLTVTDNRGATSTSQATVTIAAAGGGAPTPNPAPTPVAPVANANGPYTVVAGSPLTLSSAGSTNATSFSWALGNGQTASGASPSVTYFSAGTFTVTLTATSASGATSTAVTTVTVTSPPVVTPSALEWKVLFGPVDVANNTVAITLLYDTRVNLTETPGPEALEKFALDSLKWNPSVLQFSSVSLGPNINGTSNQNGVTSGRIGLSGTIGGAQQQGLITIATIRFSIVGAKNASTTTQTFLGPLLGPSSTNFFSYNSKTRITEGVFTVP